MKTLSFPLSAKHLKSIHYNFKILISMNFLKLFHLHHILILFSMGLLKYPPIPRSGTIEVDGKFMFNHSGPSLVILPPAMG